MTEWRHVVRPATLAQVVGDIPDVHVIAVRDRRVTVDYPTIIQNNVNTDTIELDLDGEWDGMSVVLVLGPCGGATELAWHGEPLTLPSALAEDTGGIDVSVVGYSSDGETRLVTVAAPSLLNVIKSGCTVGEEPGDETPDLIGQLVAAGDAANKAAQAANTAATAASGAAEKANTAASAANTAAEKADTAATKATEAATEATDAAGDATRAAQSANAAAEAASAAAEAARGNVLKGTLGPAPLLSADDAYATKPRRLTVFGNTRQNLWVNPSGTQNGVTVTADRNGSITLSGTATNFAFVMLKSYILRPGSTYTFSVSAAVTGARGVFLDVYNDKNSSIQTIYVGGSQNSALSKTLTVNVNAAYVLFGIGVEPGQTVSGTYRVMLNEGSEVQPWCPPGLNGVDELSIVTGGERITCETRDVSTMWATAAALPESANECLKPGTEYLLCIRVLSGTWYFNEFVFSTPTSSNNEGIFAIPVTTKGALPNTTVCIKTSSADLCVIDYCYLIEGGAATPVDLDGHSLNSLPDGTRDELRIDGTGAVTLVQRVGVATFDGSEDEAWSFTENRIGLNNGAPGSESLVGNDNGRCNTLPVREMSSSPAIMCYDSSWVDIRIDDVITDAESGKVWLAANHTTLLYPLATPKEVDLPAVTLPTLPSPNITVYNNSDVPSDITLEYERDVTIAFDKLQAQVSATAVREATNG